jgi:hypothetical protein
LRWCVSPSLGSGCVAFSSRGLDLIQRRGRGARPEAIRRNLRWTI